MGLNIKRLLALLVCIVFISDAVATVKVAHIYLIRHAEKQPGENPSLTSEGVKRALFYRDHWQSLSISHIFSSNFNRTKQTVTPIARKKNVTLEIYDPKNIRQLAEKLKKLTGNIVVVGHSNTTPQLAELLGAPFSPMPETEYDRIYRITILDEKPVDWGLLKSMP